MSRLLKLLITDGVKIRKQLKTNVFMSSSLTNEITLATDTPSYHQQFFFNKKPCNLQYHYSLITVSELSLEWLTRNKKFLQPLPSHSLWYWVENENPTCLDGTLKPKHPFSLLLQRLTTLANSTKMFKDVSPFLGYHIDCLARCKKAYGVHETNILAYFYNNLWITNANVLSVFFILYWLA